MAITLPPLPFAYTALEPYISAKTLTFHHDTHHAKYVTNTNNMVKDMPALKSASLEAIVLAAKGTNQTLFNNAGQAYNHDVYWNSLAPNGGGEPKGKVAQLINRDFGSYEAFKTQFAADANSQFGSGWAWLAQDDSGKLSVLKTSNADNPLTQGLKPLLVCDVWEHAYYVDQGPNRAAYVSAFLDKLANWDYVNSMLK